jgi:hypothetical protein
MSMLSWANRDFPGQMHIMFVYTITFRSGLKPVITSAIFFNVANTALLLNLSRLLLTDAGKYGSSVISIGRGITNNRRFKRIK